MCYSICVQRVVVGQYYLWFSVHYDTPVYLAHKLLGMILPLPPLSP